jgi:hypothetical protein
VNPGQVVRKPEESDDDDDKSGEHDRDGASLPAALGRRAPKLLVCRSAPTTCTLAYDRHHWTSPLLRYSDMHQDN